MRTVTIATACLALTVVAWTTGPPAAASEATATTPMRDAPASTAQRTKSPSVVQATLVYLPTRGGGNVHRLVVLVKNPSKKAALGVGGEVSIESSSGDLIESYTPTPINLLPKSRGLFVEDLDLPEPLTDAVVEVTLTKPTYEKGPKKSPVKFSKLTLVPDQTPTNDGLGGGCTISGVVSNTFSSQQTDLEIRWAGFVGEDLATGGFTSVDTISPKKKSTFEDAVVDPALCPDDVTGIEIVANLGEEEILNP